MGDVRFGPSLEQVEEAFRDGRLETLDAETALQALGAMTRPDARFMANAVVTLLLNRLRRSDTLLRFIQEGVVALDDEGRVLYANPAAGRMLGWEPGALLGRDFHETVRHCKTDGSDVPREDCDVLKAFGRGMEAEAPQVDDHDVFTRRDGSRFTVGFVAAPVVQQGETTGVAVVFRDITRAKEREAALALHRAALDAVPLPVFWLGRDGGFLYANAAASDHVGHPREDLTRMRVFDVDPEFTPARWDDHWARIKRGETARIRSRHRTRSGATIPVQIDVRHVEHDGEEFHVAVVQPRPDE